MHDRYIANYAHRVDKWLNSHSRININV